LVHWLHSSHWKHLHKTTILLRDFLSLLSSPLNVYKATRRTPESLPPWDAQVLLWLRNPLVLPEVVPEVVDDVAVGEILALHLVVRTVKNPVGALQFAHAVLEYH
jgi:hypothetical protein